MQRMVRFLKLKVLLWLNLKFGVWYSDYTCFVLCRSGIYFQFNPWIVIYSLLSWNFRVLSWPKVRMYPDNLLAFWRPTWPHNTMPFTASIILLWGHHHIQTFGHVSKAFWSHWGLIHHISYISVFIQVLSVFTPLGYKLTIEVCQ